MFVRNRTSFNLGLARGRLGDRGGIAAVVVDYAYRVSRGELVLCAAPPALATDPPDLSHNALWAGTSVTVAGDVLGPISAPFQRHVSLAVGPVTTHLWAFGDRQWRRDSLGVLRPTAPAPFERMALSFTRAYGGYFDVPAGLYPGTELPFPGGRFGYALNQAGVGFYPDEGSAETRPLPNFELAHRTIQRWNDRPTPGCFVPCPDLPALRMDSLEGFVPAQKPVCEDVLTRDKMLSIMLRAQHPAPGYLIFDEVEPGTTVRVDGVGGEAVCFRVPAPPARVTVRRGKSDDEVGPKLRSIHIDVDQSIVRCVAGYSFVYRDGEEPSWIIVNNRAPEGSR